MSKLFSRLAGVAAAAALVLSVGVGCAAANVSAYQWQNDVVTIHTSNISAAAGTTTTAPVTVSLSGDSPILIGRDSSEFPAEGIAYLFDQYGASWPTSSFDGLSFPKYGCWNKVLYPGQSCTSTILFRPNFVGTHNEAYVLNFAAAPWGYLMYGTFTATGRPVPVPVAPSSALAP